MKELLAPCLVVASSVVALGAHAAGQGSLGSTSTATLTVTVTGDQLPRQVQVLNVSDMSITSATRAEIDATNPGASFSFCVVDTYGGTVLLTVTNSQGYDVGQGWILSANPLVGYQVTVWNTTNSTRYGFSNSGAGSSFNASIPSGVARTDAAACTSSGNNLKMHAVLNAAIPVTNPASSFSSTVTIVATPV